MSLPLLRRAALAMSVTALMSTTVLAQEAKPAVACGGDLAAFLKNVKAEAMALGVPADAADKALAGAQIDPKVLARDRAQGVFRQTFLEFSQRTVIRRVWTSDGRS